LSSALATLAVDVQLVFVDDGSGDETLAVLHRIADSDPRVSVIALSRNWGHQIALTAGLEHAVGDAVVTMDSDLQHPPVVIAEMVRAFERGTDIVYGVRRSAARVGWLKRICSKGFYYLLRRATRVDVVPDAADFRLMSRRVVASLRQMREVHRYLRGMVPWLGFSSAIVYYDQPPRTSGRASYTLVSSLRLARHAVFSFSGLPLLAISAMGVMFALLSVLYLAYVIIVAMSGQAVPGWSSVIAVVLVVSAVQFLSMSVLAQYLGMLFEQVKERPLYVLKVVRLAPGVPRRVPDDVP
jgi:dolichol-phosphate mannosyltransferase